MTVGMGEVYQRPCIGGPGPSRKAKIIENASVQIGYTDGLAFHEGTDVNCLVALFKLFDQWFVSSKKKEVMSFFSGMLHNGFCMFIVQML